MKQKPNAGEPKERAEALRELALEQRQQAEDMRAVLALTVGNRHPGRELLQRLMDDCQVFEEGFEASSRIYFLQGRRSVGLELRKLIRAAEPRALFEMEMKQVKEETFDGNR